MSKSLRNDRRYNDEYEYEDVRQTKKQLKALRRDQRREKAAEREDG